MTCKGKIIGNGIPIKMEIYVVSGYINNLELFNDDNPDYRAALAITAKNLVRPAAWQNSNCDDLWLGCDGQQVSSLVWPPCLIDLAYIGNTGPYYILIWGSKLLNNQWIPLTNDDGISIIPSYRITSTDAIAGKDSHGNTSLILLDWQPLSSNYQSFNKYGLNAFAFQPNDVKLIQSIVPQTNVIGNNPLSPSVFLEIDVLGNQNMVSYPSSREFNTIATNPYTSQAAAYISGDLSKFILSTIGTGCLNQTIYCWMDLLCGNPLGLPIGGFCNCVASNIPSNVCSCLDPNGQLLFNRNSGHC